MASVKSETFVDATVKNLTEDQKTLLEGHFVKQHNKKVFVKAMKFSVSAGLVVGAFIGIVAFGKNLGDGFFK